MGQTVHLANPGVPHELNAFTQESAHLWHRHTHLLQANSKKVHGVVYTPDALVSILIALIFDELAPSGPVTVLDPSCGTGNFLVQAYKRLAQDCLTSTSESRIKLLGDSIFGCDIDVQAVEIAKRRLWQTAFEGTGEWVPFDQFPHSNFAIGDALSLLPADDPRRLFPGTGWGLWLASVFQQEFDVIVGNPPYGKTRLTNVQRQYFASSLYGHANTYSLFLHMGINLLKLNGVLGYVVPASMLSGLYFQNLRRYLSEQCRFRAIVQFDKRAGIFESVLQEIMLLVVQRGPATGPHTVRVATVEHETQLADWPTFSRLVRQVPDRTILRQSGGYGLIHIPTRRGADVIYEKYERHGLPLTHASIGYVAKTGPIVWNRLKTSLRDNPAQDTRPLIWANNVNCYHFTADGNRDERSGYLLCDERTLPLMTHGSCLLIQRITAKEQRRRIVAAFPREWEDSTGSFFVENHLNLVMPIKGAKSLPSEYVLALLNSRLFDFIFRTFNGNTQVSATELNVMRFAVPDASTADEAAKLVRRLERARAANQLALAAELAERLDQVVYDLYRLTSDEVEIIASHTQRAIK